MCGVLLVEWGAVGFGLGIEGWRSQVLEAGLAWGEEGEGVASNTHLH